MKDSLREDIALWHAGDTAASPMGYLICGPVGTGKTYSSNAWPARRYPGGQDQEFPRDKWVGSTEGNLEKIFRLLHGLDRCYVFIDEADQGARKARPRAATTVGWAAGCMGCSRPEMSNPANRGRIVWVLASSRPDLIEVDLKRPGRVDVKLAAVSHRDAGGKLRAPAGVVPAARNRVGRPRPRGEPRTISPAPDPRRGGDPGIEDLPHDEKRGGNSAAEALAEALADYQNPVPLQTLRFQIALAVAEASDRSFVPTAFREMTAE